MSERSGLPGFAALMLLGAGVAVAVSSSWRQTEEQIAVNERNYKLRALNEIIPAERYDNSLFDDVTTAFDPELLGSDAPVAVYRARKNDEPVAVIMRVVAPKGYSGSIILLVGINVDGTVAGVRAAEHNETRGLGDEIDLQRSDWILSFNNRSIGDPPDSRWLVRRDGGVFDQFTGATITPRAVVKAVRNALVYFDANREQLFARSSEP